MFIADLDNASFLDFTREALTILKLLVRRISCWRTYKCVGLDYLDIVSLPLDEALVHCWGDAAISMDPDTTKEQTICPFAINDEERSGQSLTPNCQLNANCPWVLDVLPPKSFSIMSASSKSSRPFPSLWNMV